MISFGYKISHARWRSALLVILDAILEAKVIQYSILFVLIVFLDPKTYVIIIINIYTSEINMEYYD